MQINRAVDKSNCITSRGEFSAQADKIRFALEALLFSSDKPLLIQQLKNVFEGLRAEDLRNILEELKSEYEKQSRGIRVLEIAGGFQMVSAPEYGSFLKKFYRQAKKERLSRPALETLAIIAYKQPLTRLEVESIRGVNTDGVIASLLVKGLIRVAGRRRAAGRPYVYATSRKFLEYFGLKSLSELPEISVKENISRELIGLKECADKHKQEAQKDEVKDFAKENR
jgi:segregation and condensation protein B